MFTDYSDPDLRREQRRKLLDRRDLIRREPHKAERRQGHDRRRIEQFKPG
ncbi:hypothetical protein [Zobellella sp. DQSA1]